MKDQIYDYNSYRSFLKDQFPTKGEARGKRKFLAEKLGCQVSFLGLVLTQRAHLNSEMLWKQVFIWTTKEERDFFDVVSCRAENYGIWCRFLVVRIFEY